LAEPMQKGVISWPLQ